MKILVRIILSILVVAIFMVPAASAIGHQTATFIKGGEVGLLAYTLWSALYCGVLAASFLSALFIWSPGLSVEFWRCKEVKTKTRPPQVQQCIDKGRACTADDLTKLSLDDMQTVLAYFKKRDPGHWRALSAQIDRLGKDGNKDQESPLTAALRQRAEGITQGLKAAGLGQPKPAHADVTNILLTGELQTLFKAVKGLHGKSREGAGDSPEHTAVMRDALVLLGYALQPNTWHFSVWAENGQAHIQSLWHPKVQDAVALVNTWGALSEEDKRATVVLWDSLSKADEAYDLPIMHTERVKEWQKEGKLTTLAKKRGMTALSAAHTTLLNTLCIREGVDQDQAGRVIGRALGVWWHLMHPGYELGGVEWQAALVGIPEQVRVLMRYWPRLSETTQGRLLAVMDSEVGPHAGAVEVVKTKEDMEKAARKLAGEEKPPRRKWLFEPPALNVSPDADQPADLVLGQEVAAPEERKGETAHPSSFAELVDQALEQEAPQTKDTDAA